MLPTLFWWSLKATANWTERNVDKNEHEKTNNSGFNAVDQRNLWACHSIQDIKLGITFYVSFPLILHLFRNRFFAVTCKKIPYYSRPSLCHKQCFANSWTGVLNLFFNIVFNSRIICIQNLISQKYWQVT